jgi:hypothetical protein
MEIIEKATHSEHERVLFGRDAASGYRKGPPTSGTMITWSLQTFARPAP